MAYHLYHTEGIVLGGKDTGESNRFYFILTRDLGLIGAAAQGARELKSKLRGHLAMGSMGTMTFVRGRDVWRITAADTRGFSAEDKENVRMAARVAQLVRRLVHGEERDRALYQEVSSALTFLYAHRLKAEEARLFEAVFAARVLDILGYGTFDGDLSRITEGVWGKELLVRGASLETPLVRAVNAALRASHL